MGEPASRDGVVKRQKVVLLPMEIPPKALTFRIKLLYIQPFNLEQF
jgi:hypothetical protein